MFAIQRQITTGKIFPQGKFVSWWTGHSFGAKCFRGKFTNEEVDSQLANIHAWIAETEATDDGYRVVVNYRRNNYKFQIIKIEDEDEQNPFEGRG